MGSFNGFLDAEFRPPRNWSLISSLKFKSETLTREQRDLLVECGIQVTKTTSTITVPKGYITDLASVPRICWTFIAPFDCARAAVVHDIMYEKINGAFKKGIIESKAEREIYRKIADNMLTRLHWALKCGNEGGDLNDVLYTVKALGMVVSTDVDFDSGPAVMNGFSLRWQSIFGGLGEFFKNGKDDGGYSGIHARSAIGGFTGRFSIEPEIIVAIPSELSIAIIKNRGWLFPVDPRVQSQLKK